MLTALRINITNLQHKLKVLKGFITKCTLVQHFHSLSLSFSFTFILFHFHPLSLSFSFIFILFHFHPLSLSLLIAYCFIHIQSETSTDILESSPDLGSQSTFIALRKAIAIF